MSLAHRLADSATVYLDKHSNAVKLTLTTIAASALTVSAILSYQGVRRQLRVRALKRELLSEKTHDKKLTQWGTVVDAIEYDETLIDEQLTRNSAFLGPEGVAKVRHAKVVVIGVGAVGSYCALMLARSGVQQIRLVDPAIITLQTLASHAVAGHDDIGRPKALALKREIQKIARFVNVECRVEKLTVHSIRDIVSDEPDFVVDTMGRDMGTKVQLAKYCHDHHLRLVSAMSVEGKVDPTRMQLADISNTRSDPQCRALRRRLRKLGVETGLIVAFSSEKPYPVQQSQDKAIPDFLSRQMPVFGPASGMFGMMLAAHIILQLGEFPSYHNTESSAHCADCKRTRECSDEIRRREKSSFGDTSCSLSAGDVGYILDELWDWKSILSGPHKELTLVRWDRSKPLDYLNAVAMSRSEAKKHDALPANANLRDVYGEATIQYVETQIEIEHRLQQLTP